jgi:hypothetical protein
MLHRVDRRRALIVSRTIDRRNPGEKTGSPMNHPCTDVPAEAKPAGEAAPASCPTAPALAVLAPLDRPFQLATPAPLRPAVTLGLGLPARVSGLPAFYYWKDAIVVGSYVHPAGRFALEVTRDRLDAYVNTFARMRANGVGVPILMDHAPSAAATLGWIVDVKRRGDRLLELHQFLGEAARDVGLRNFVSLGIDPDFVDGRGVRYGEAIVHSAVTPTPVVPGQGGFEQADPGQEMVTLSLAIGENPTSDIRHPDQIPVTEIPVDAADDSGGDADGDGLKAAVKAEVSPPPPQAAPLAPAVAVAAQAAPTMQLALAALADAAAAKRDMAVARGGVAPAVADELFALLVRSTDGSLNVMALSRTPAAAGESTPSAPLALAVFDALSRNHPVPLGQATHLQVLSRLIPGEDDEQAELRERMIALASARR